MNIFGEHNTEKFPRDICCHLFYSENRILPVSILASPICQTK